MVLAGVRDVQHSTTAPAAKDAGKQRPAAPPSFGVSVGAERKLRAVRIQHPRGNRKGRAVSELANCVFGIGSFLALTNLQGLAAQWVPTVVNRDGLEMTGIM